MTRLAIRIFIEYSKKYGNKEYEKVTNEPAKQPIKIKDKAILVVDVYRIEKGRNSYENIN